MIHIRVQYLTGHIVKLNTVEMRSLRPWTKLDSALSDSHFAERHSNSRAHRMCSEQLVDTGKHLLSEFSKYKFGGQLQPTNMVARRPFRAIPGNRANRVVKACHMGGKFLYIVPDITPVIYYERCHGFARDMWKCRKMFNGLWTTSGHSTNKDTIELSVTQRYLYFAYGSLYWMLITAAGVMMDMCPNNTQIIF